MTSELFHYSAIYKTELLERVIPFWIHHSKDDQAGGYFTCLDRYGRVFDTDKFVWLQAREVWFFSMIYNQIEKNPEWLDMARHGADFLEKYGRDPQGNWFFSLMQDGTPLIQPYNIYTDAFAALGFGEFFKATLKEKYKTIALTTFNNIIRRQGQPKGIYEKHYPGSRPMKNFAFPMVLSYLAVALEEIIGYRKVNELSGPLLEEILVHFRDKETGYLLENINPNNTFIEPLKKIDG